MSRSTPVASGIAIGMSLLLGVTLGFHALFLAIPAVLATINLRQGGLRRLPVIVCACVLVGAVRGGAEERGATQVPLGGSRQAIGIVSSLPIAGGDFERTLMWVEQAEMPDGAWTETSGHVVVYLPEHGEGVSLHDRIVVRWDVTDLSELAPGYGGYVRSQGAVGSGQIFSYEIEEEGSALFDAMSDARRSVSTALTTALPGDAGALASGFVTGDDSGLQGTTEGAFQRTGTQHLTSVSGQNISLLISFLSLWYTPSGPIRRIAVHAAMLLVVWTYAVIVGLEAPALRAATVASLTILGSYSGRKPDPLTLMALTLGAMALIDPRMTHSVGFWLSASASIALCSVVLPEAPEGIRKQVLNVLMGPVAASLATLPIVIWTFHEWSPITPLANALLAPVMTFLFPVVYVFAGLAVLPVPIAHLVAWIPGIGLDLSLAVVQRLDGVNQPLYLDGISALGSVMIALPCVVAIALLSRDGERWLRIARRAW